MLRGVDFIDITSLVGWGIYDIFYILTFILSTNHVFWKEGGGGGGELTVLGDTKIPTPCLHFSPVTG